VNHGIQETNFDSKVTQSSTIDSTTQGTFRMSMGMMLRCLFTRRDLPRLVLLTLLMVFSSSMEVFGIGMLFPYVSLLEDPSRISSTRYISAVYGGLGFTSHRTFLIAMSAFLLVTFCLKGFLTLWVANSQLRFANAKLETLGRTLLSRYLHRPYAFFLSNNSSVLIGNLTTSLAQLCGGVIQTTLTLASEGLVAIGLIAFLILMSPVFSLSAMVFIGGLSLFLKRVIRDRIVHHAVANEQHWKAMIRTVNESLSSAKEVLVLGCQDYFVNAYSAEMKQYSRAQRRYGLLAQFPRVALETGAVAGMVVFALFAMLGGNFGPNLFAVLAVFSIATVRIVPSATRMLQAWNTIAFYRPSMEIIVAGLSEGDTSTSLEIKQVSVAPDLHLREALTVSIKFFAYPTNPHFVLADIDLTIRRGQTVGLIGHTGCGKTTLVDLILGLFPRFDGTIKVDGLDIRANLAGWRRQIGYIPQNIYLRDDTIIRNVAFGVPEAQIDLQAVERAICLAGLEPVIRTQPDGLETVVGDRGVRLSGGERQRIGIARALYHDPELLVLDEATSALDNETERQIVDSILGLSLSKTVIVIAHRLSTVENCDIVCLMRSGTIVDRGPFSLIVERTPALVNP
jgi:ABC-type multidrug transport system fused ATPase/permease subunit